ncbi:MAG: redoxin domain-containing protein [Bacteroidales bacterium]|nr:redoxin domain-containing protein [Bacteroidales bacterium]MCF8391866.1 redoxin domain-containing protein [Bacteroidales bacterium]
MKHQIIILALLLFSNNFVKAQQDRGQKIPLIGTQAPAFKASSTNGPISFPSDFEGKWKILFAHPRDFTPVCSSEILELAYLQDEFNALNCQIVVISVDRMVSHLSWKADLEGIDYKGRGQQSINFPLVVDSSSDISYRYGMIDPDMDAAQTVRGIFFIDPANTVRAFQFYPNEVGRNTDEIIRTLKALQAHDKDTHTVLPGNWHPGDDYMLPALSPKDKEELKKPDSKIHYINWYMIYKKGDS